MSYVLRPTEREREGLPVISSETGQATLVPVGTYRPQIVLPVVYSIHASSMSVRGELRLSCGTTKLAWSREQQLPGKQKKIIFHCNSFQSSFIISF